MPATESDMHLLIFFFNQYDYLPTYTYVTMFLAGAHRARDGQIWHVILWNRSFRQLWVIMCVLWTKCEFYSWSAWGLIHRVSPQLLLYIFMMYIFCKSFLRSANILWSDSSDWKCHKWLKVMKHHPNLVLWNVIKNECNLSGII